MSNNKKWSVFYKVKYDEWHVAVPVEGESMTMALFPNGVPGKTAKERRDLAHLIAAAPILLAALKSLLALVEGECPRLLEDDHHWQMAKDAIAAAEGESDL